MVSFSKLLKPIALGFATWATTAYAAEEMRARIGDQDVTFVRGSVHGGANLTERAAIPPECSFEGARCNFDYVQITGIDGTACVGWDNFNSCGAGPWADPDWTDIQHAMRDIVAMDGQWGYSEAGAWRGTFKLFTTAFSDRNTGLFIMYFTLCDIRPLKIYWSRNGDFAQVIGHDAICP
jgi:hypothetical protein